MRSFPLLGHSRSWAIPAPGPFPLLGHSRSWAIHCLFSFLFSGLILSLTCSAYAQGNDSGPAGYTVTYSIPPVVQGKSMDSQDTLTNTVTATLTWQGTGPAPAVIVEEDAAASWFIALMRPRCLRRGARPPLQAAGYRLLLY